MPDDRMPGAVEVAEDYANLSGQLETPGVDNKPGPVAGPALPPAPTSPSAAPGVFRNRLPTIDNTSGPSGRTRKQGSMAAWRASVHHTHLMASDLDASLEFYRRWFDAVVVADLHYAGARNVFVAVGSGRLHFYDQPPRTTERNALNHVGLVIERLDELADAMAAAGVPLPKGVQRYPDGNYLMVEAPDRVLLELFEPNWKTVSTKMRAWFELGEVRPELRARDSDGSATTDT